jgi:hypothetical protein
MHSGISLTGQQQIKSSKKVLGIDEYEKVRGGEIQIGLCMLVVIFAFVVTGS